MMAPWPLDRRQSPNAVGLVNVLRIAVGMLGARYKGIEDGSAGLSDRDSRGVAQTNREPTCSCSTAPARHEASLLDAIRPR